MSEDNENIPGMAIFSNLLRLQTQAAERHLKAVNDIWNDVLEDTSAKSVMNGYNKLTQVCFDNAKELLAGYTAPLIAATTATTDCPNVVFAIDQAADNGGDPRQVPLPRNANGDLLQTPFDPPIKNADGTEAKLLTVAPSADNLFAQLAIGNLGGLPKPRSGTHRALVYLDSKPTPKLPVAVVIVSFIP